MKREIKNLLCLLIPSAVLVFIDQVTKIFAAGLLKGKQPFVIIPGVLEFQYLENTGAAWGMFSGARWFFIVLTVAVLAFVLVETAKIPDVRHYKWLLSAAILLTAGALGNFIDRVLLHYVRDFIYISAINFPIFNVADICVTASVIVLLIGILFIYKDEELAFLSFKKSSAAESEQAQGKSEKSSGPDRTQCEGDRS